jgi:hypothetical protein
VPAKVAHVHHAELGRGVVKLQPQKIAEDLAYAEILVPQDCPDPPRKPDLPRKLAGLPDWIRARRQSRITIPSSRHVTGKLAVDPDPRSGSGVSPSLKLSTKPEFSAQKLVICYARAKNARMKPVEPAGLAR